MICYHGHQIYRTESERTDNQGCREAALNFSRYSLLSVYALVDEPTGNLDSKTSMDVLGLMKTSGERFGQTIVMITHNDEIAQMAGRIIRLEDGRICGQSGQSDRKQKSSQGSRRAGDFHA